MGDYKADQPNRVLKDAADLYAALARLMKDFVFNDKRALAEVNADYATTTELADTLQRLADVPFRVGHHFASELVNFGRRHLLTPSEIPYNEAQRIYTEAAKLYGVNDAKLPLTEAQFRTSLTAENMVQASQGLGGPQPADVARMLAAQKAGVEAERAWLAAVQGRLTHLTDGQ
jgi:argininosuccinate lyase